MKRALTFASRNFKELVRDPLSYIFCIGFPIVMLGLMTLINSAIPKEANMTLFNIDKLAPGVAVFGLSFVMLFATLSVSKDRTSAFLTRLLSSPMKASDFIIGYSLPLLLIVIAQFFITYISAFIIAIFTDNQISVLGMLLSIAVLMPTAVFFIAIGIFFGTLFSEKAAPPCSSIIISLCGVMGGIWFDLAVIPSDNILFVICKILPFSHATDAARASVALEYSNILTGFIITLIWAFAASVLAIITFKLKMKSDKK